MWKLSPVCCFRRPANISQNLRSLVVGLNAGDFYSSFNPIIEYNNIFNFIGLSHARKDGMSLHGNTISKKILSICIFKSIV